MTFRLPVFWDRAMKTSQNTDHHLARSRQLSLPRFAAGPWQDALVEKSLRRLYGRSLPLVLVDTGIMRERGSRFGPPAFLKTKGTSVAIPPSDKRSSVPACSRSSTWGKASVLVPAGSAQRGGRGDSRVQCAISFPVLRGRRRRRGPLLLQEGNQRPATPPSSKLQGKPHLSTCHAGRRGRRVMGVSRGEERSIVAVG